MGQSSKMGLMMVAKKEPQYVQRRWRSLTPFSPCLSPISCGLFPGRDYDFYDRYASADSPGIPQSVPTEADHVIKDLHTLSVQEMSGYHRRSPRQQPHLRLRSPNKCYFSYHNEFPNEWTQS